MLDSLQWREGDQDMSVEIVRVDASNRRVLENVADVFDEAINFAFVDAYLAAPNHIMLVAIDEGLVVGQIRGVVHVHPDRLAELYVDNVGVDDAYQRRGIATGLLAELREVAGAMGAEDMWVATEADNAGAIGFYRSVGMAGNGMIYFESDA